MFWKKKFHKLPKFPSSIRPHYKQLCSLASEDQLLELKLELEKNIKDVRSLSESKLDYPISDAENCNTVCCYLIDNYNNFSKREQSLIVGAVKYFVSDVDPFHEAIFVSGLHDDKKILNYVLEELKIENMYLNVT